MAKKTTKNRADLIIDAYMNHILEEGEAPKSMYKFAKSIKLKESEVYEHFTSFDAIDLHVYRSFFERTIALLNKDKTYKSYDAKDKLISFYFTFFELLKVNRTYVVSSLEMSENKLRNLKKLSELRDGFKEYVNGLGISKVDLKQPKLEKIQSMGISEFAWNQLLVTLAFWINDTSAGFEKTDIFIEKGINTWFEVMRIEPLESIIDLGKFLIREKFGVKA